MWRRSETRRLAWVVCILLQICVLQTGQGKFFKGIGWGLGLLLEGERQQTPALVWGWAISHISFLAPQSPQLIKNYLQANIVLTAPMWQEAAGVLLSTDAQRGCSHVHWNALQNPPLKQDSLQGPHIVAHTDCRWAAANTGCSICFVLLLLERRKIPLNVLCALSSAPVSCPCERCKK